MILKIERLNHTGEGLGIKDGIVFFVPKTIPGDIINLKEKDIIYHKNYNEVTNYTLIEKSKDRVKVECPYYQECGGCQLMHLSYENQLHYKKEKVKEIFKKYANIEIDPEIIPSHQFKYRNKITLQVNKGELGLFFKKTNHIIPIDTCLLIPDNINKIIPLLQKLNIKELNQIILKTINQEVMVQFIGKINKDEVIDTLKDKVASIYINNTLIKGTPFLTENLPPYQFKVSPNSFFQINHESTINLYNKAKEYLGNNNKDILDLYCGTGTIGIYVSENCNKITGIEINESSVKDAQENIKINHLKNINIIKGNVGEILKSNKEYDAIIVDPPRSGLDKRTIKTLEEIKSPKIIYISCNPITLARDINRLNNNYTLKEITLVDMFPNTYHVETVIILKRKTS